MLFKSEKSPALTMAGNLCCSLFVQRCTVIALALVGGKFSITPVILCYCHQNTQQCHRLRDQTSSLCPTGTAHSYDRLEKYVSHLYVTTEERQTVRRANNVCIHICYLWFI